MPVVSFKHPLLQRCPCRKIVAKSATGICTDGIPLERGNETCFYLQTPKCQKHTGLWLTVSCYSGCQWNKDESDNRGARLLFSSSAFPRWSPSSVSNLIHPGTNVYIRRSPFLPKPSFIKRFLIEV